MNDALRRLVPTVYLVALFFVVIAVVDLVSNVWPLDPGNEQWRYGLVALLVNHLVSILFGGMLAALAAAATDSRRMLRLLGFLAVTGTVLLAITGLGLLLDTIQLRSLVRPEEAAMFKIGTAKAGVKIVAIMVGFVVMARGCFTAAKTLSQDAPPAPLVR